MSRGGVRFNAIWLRRVTTRSVSIRSYSVCCGDSDGESCARARIYACRAYISCSTSTY